MFRLANHLIRSQMMIGLHFPVVKYSEFLSTDYDQLLYVSTHSSLFSPSLQVYTCVQVEISDSYCNTCKMQGSKMSDVKFNTWFETHIRTSPRISENYDGSAGARSHTA